MHGVATAAQVVTCPCYGRLLHPSELGQDSIPDGDSDGHSKSDDDSEDYMPDHEIFSDAQGGHYGIPVVANENVATEQ